MPEQASDKSFGCQGDRLSSWYAHGKNIWSGFLIEAGISPLHAAAEGSLGNFYPDESLKPALRLLHSTMPF